jgi:hypothetical protein
MHTELAQSNGAISKVDTKFISHLIRIQHTLPAAQIVHVSQALQAVRLSCLMRGRGTSLKDGVAAGEDFLCAPF